MTSFAFYICCFKVLGPISSTNQMFYHYPPLLSFRIKKDIYLIRALQHWPSDLERMYSPCSPITIRMGFSSSWLCTALAEMDGWSDVYLNHDQQRVDPTHAWVCDPKWNHCICGVKKTTKYLSVLTAQSNSEKVTNECNLVSFFPFMGTNCYVCCASVSTFVSDLFQ